MKTDCIYMDYAATTPVDPRVAAYMADFLGPDGLFANPASPHGPGRAARKVVEENRARAAAAIGARPEELVFTSGATESINLALKGAVCVYTRHGGRARHVVVCRTEHKASLDTCAALEAQGYEVSWLDPDTCGRLDPERVRAALRDDTVLVTVMHANNELGVINDVRAIADIAHGRGALVHVDAAQSVGKVPVDVAELDADMLSFSGHKLYGPKGIGGLFVRSRPRRIQLDPQCHGGGHERGMRSGTLPTHQIAGFGLACELAAEALSEEGQRLRTLKQRLWEGLSSLDGVILNGDLADSVPGILNLSFEGVEGESLRFGLPDLAVSSGSACTSTDAAPSYVLRALGRDEVLAEASLRFSVGRFSSEADVDGAVSRVVAEVRRQRSFSGWEAGAKG